MLRSAVRLRTEASKNVAPLAESLRQWMQEPGDVSAREFFASYEEQLPGPQAGRAVYNKLAAELYLNVLRTLSTLHGGSTLGVQSVVLDLMTTRRIPVTPQHITCILKSPAVHALSSTDQVAHARELVALLPDHADTTDPALNETLLMLLSQLGNKKGSARPQAAAVFAAYSARGTEPTPKMIVALATFACTSEGVFSCFAKLPKRGGGGGGGGANALPRAGELRALCQECARVGDAEAVVCIFQYALHVLKTPGDFVGYLAQVVDPATPPADVVSLWEHGKVYFSTVRDKTRFATNICNALVTLSRERPALSAKFKAALETVSGEVVALYTEAKMKESKEYAALQKRVRTLSPETADLSILPHAKVRDALDHIAVAGETRKVSGKGGKKGRRAKASSA